MNTPMPHVEGLHTELDSAIEASTPPESGISYETDFWHRPLFAYQVTINGRAALFEEVAGHDATTQRCEFPAIRLIRGRFGEDTAFQKWRNIFGDASRLHAFVIISLLDECGYAAMTWHRRNVRVDVTQH